MFRIGSIMKSDEQIIALASLNKELIAYNTKSAGITIVNVQSSKEILHLRTNTKDSTFFLFTLSPNKKRLAYVSDGYIHVLETLFRSDTFSQDVKLINKIAINYKATTLKFDPTSTYIFVGSEDNTIYQYRYNMLYILSKYHLFDKSKKRTKGISLTVFDGEIMYVSGNRGDLAKVNIYSKKTKYLLTQESTTINDMLFKDKESIITAHANGDLRIVATKTSKEYESIDTIFTHIKQIIYMQNRKYMLVCGDASYISLVDIENKKILLARYLSFEYEVKSMLLVSEFVLIVLLVDNTLIRIDIPTPRDLQSHILHSSLNEAYNLVKKEPILLESQSYKDLENRYQELVQRVVKEIPNQNKAFAKQTISFFEDVQSKKDEIALIFRAFDSYKKFQELFFGGEYASAYNLAHRFPALKTTPEYLRMETIYKETFQQAQEYLLKGKKVEAHALLRKYMTAVPKKAMIKLFLNHEQEFLPYLDVIKSRDVRQLKAIAQEDSNFSKYLEYLNIDLEDKNANKQFDMLKKYLERGELTQAQALLTQLETKENAKLLRIYKERLKQTQELYTAYKEQNYQQCYEMIDRYEFLEENKLTQFLDNYWKKLVIKAQKYALNGDVKVVQQLFVKFEGLQSRKEKIDEVVKLSFYVEIVSLLELKSYTLAKTFIQDYISLYEYDEILRPLVKEFNSIAEEPITPPNERESKKDLLKKLSFLKS